MANNFSSIDYDKLADAISKKLTPMLENVAAAAGGDKELTGTLTIKGDIAQLVAKAVETSPSLVRSLG